MNMKKYLLFAIIFAVLSVGSIANAYSRDDSEKPEVKVKNVNVRKEAINQCNQTFEAARKTYKDTMKVAETVAKNAKKAAETVYKSSTKDDVAKVAFKSAKKSAQDTLSSAKESARSVLKVATTAKNGCVRANKK